MPNNSGLIISLFGKESPLYLFGSGQSPFGFDTIEYHPARAVTDGGNKTLSALFKVA